MKLYVVSNHRFARDAAGRVVSSTGTHSASFWQRYLNVFDHVTVVARCGNDVVANPPICSDHVSFRALPAKGWRHHRRIGSQLAAQIASERAAIILRPPGIISPWFASALRKQNHPYAVEVTGDPQDALAAGASVMRFRAVFRALLTRELRTTCRHANAVAYVNRLTLPKRYPISDGRYWTHYSNVEMPTEAFVAVPRTWQTTRPATLITVASLDREYKGIHHLIDAVGILRRDSVDVNLKIIGDGRLKNELKQPAESLGMGDHVHFAGRLPPGDAIRERLDAADLFVLPSLTEGLPRAMIEAMGRGLPCLGSNVGGIPELLEPSELFRAGDAEAIAASISRLICDRERMEKLSARNLQAASAFHQETLSERRDAFYRHLENASSAPAFKRAA